MPPDLIDASVANGAKGIVIAGVGNGNMNKASLDGGGQRREEGRRRGAEQPRRNRLVGRNVEVNDDELGFIASDELNPQKSRILLALALLKKSTPRTNPDDVPHLLTRWIRNQWNEDRDSASVEPGSSRRRAGRRTTRRAPGRRGRPRIARTADGEDRQLLLEPLALAAGAHRRPARGDDRLELVMTVAADVLKNRHRELILPPPPGVLMTLDSTTLLALKNAWQGAIAASDRLRELAPAVDALDGEISPDALEAFRTAALAQAIAAQALRGMIEQLQRGTGGTDG